MVERAGYGWLKYSAITALTSANWPRLVRYRPTRATSSSEPPAASQTAPRLSNARRACAAMSPATSRSEEHTSELQSLMRSSYAVFCLKKNTLVVQLVNHRCKQTNLTLNAINSLHLMTYHILLP